MTFAWLEFTPRPAAYKKPRACRVKRHKAEISDISALSFFLSFLLEMIVTPAGYHLRFGRAVHGQLLKHFPGLGDVLAHVVSEQQGVRHLLLGPLVALFRNFQQFLVQPGSSWGSANDAGQVRETRLKWER